MATTTRLALPMLEAGQAQKEMFHNEALALLDLLVGASVEAALRDDPPAQPEVGQSWIVGPAATGDWAGKAGAIAGWTPGGWRFISPPEGFSVWDRATGTIARRVAGSWRSDRPGAAIAPPAGGSTVDTEARAAIAAMLTLLRQRGLIAA